MTLYLLRFNNYVNRILKRFDSFGEYASYVLPVSPVQNGYTNFNFNPNDGVMTEIIVGQGEFIDIPDYCLVCDDSNEINSRWFVLEAIRTRGGQYSLKLYRDTVADYWDIITQSPAFVEKGYINDANNPLIFNREDMTFNQIKRNEILIKDKTKRAWIIGYIAPDAENIWKTYATFDGTFNYPLTTYDAIKAYADEGDIRCFNDAEVYYNGINDFTEAEAKVHNITITKTSYNVESTNVGSGAVLNFGAQINNRSKLADVCNGIVDDAFTSNTLKSNLFSLYNLRDLDLTQYNGKIVLDSETGLFYKINVTKSAIHKTETFYSTTITNTQMQNIKTEMLYIVRSQNYISENTPSTQYLPTVSVNASYTTQRLSLELISNKGLNVEFQSTARQTEDAPYYMFAIPYSENNMRLAIQIGVLLGNNLYDMQLMPYCPVQDYYLENGTVDLDGLTVGKDYEPIKDDTTTIDYLFWCPKANFFIDIPFSLPVSINPIEKKIESECDMYRLCSPNGNGEFQFNAAKNNGVTNFNVDCTYRPINPYVHLNPDFGGLYGYDANDFRGLILQGDFSVPLLSDQWVQYEINNKNYQNSFNRQIENLEVQQKMGRIQDIANAITGTGTGAASGALAGSMIAPGVGTGVGAIVGGVASAAGGVADIFINEKLRKEAIDYTTDQFGYQLGNIQAMPQSIVKTGCLTANNKKFPYLEYYSCTDVEKQALRNKIKYNGMTIMIISETITDFINPNNSEYTYLKAKIIRLNGLDDEYHLADVIVKELNQGVFV